MRRIVYYPVFNINALIKGGRMYMKLLSPSLLLPFFVGLALSITTPETVAANDVMEGVQFENARVYVQYNHPFYYHHHKGPYFYHGPSGPYRNYYRYPYRPRGFYYRHGPYFHHRRPHGDGVYIRFRVR